MDSVTTDTAKIELMRDNEIFRNLVLKHQTYEQRLAELAVIHFPNEEEQLEEAMLKKKKLAVKDEMYSMLEEHAVSH